VADAEALPLADGSFTHILSVFGVVGAPRPERAVAEMFRGCRPDGVVGLTALPTGSYMAELAHAIRGALSDENVFADPERAWGSEEVVCSRLEPHASTVDVHRATLDWDPAVRSAAGRADCAGSYFAARVPEETLARIVDARMAVESRFAARSGRLLVEYMVVTARPRPVHRGG